MKNVVTFLLAGISIVSVFYISFFILNVWALTVLWSWFIPPIFGVGDITYTSAAGLWLVAGLLNPRQDIPCEDARTTAEKTAVALGTLARPVVTVFFGWIVKSIAGF